DSRYRGRARPTGSVRRTRSPGGRRKSWRPPARCDVRPMFGAPIPADPPGRPPAKPRLFRCGGGGEGKSRLEKPAFPLAGKVVGAAVERADFVDRAAHRHLVDLELARRGV